MNDRRDAYYLSTDQRQQRWYLWLFDDSEPGYEIDEIVAHCPHAGLDPTVAAERLLRAFWKDDDLNQGIGWPSVQTAGLLTEQQILAIAKETTARGLGPMPASG